MKKILIVVSLIFLSGSCNQSGSNKNTLQKNNIEMEKKDREAIENLLNTYKNSLNSSDAYLAMRLYTVDGLFMPTEAPTATGHDQILNSYQFIFSQIQLNIQFYIEEISIDGNLAYATTSSKGTVLIHATAESMAESNRELFVFEKVNNEWKIARYMFNKTQAKS